MIFGVASALYNLMVAVYFSGAWITQFRTVFYVIKACMLAY
ncbi:hypothetical protein JMUB7504_27030 [Staphylococcus aureus]